MKTIEQQIEEIFKVNPYSTALSKIEERGLKKEYIKAFGYLNWSTICKEFKN